MYHRLAEVSDIVASHPKSAFLVSTPTNIRYLTGFSPLASGEREAFLLVAPQKTILFHSSLAKPKIQASIVTTPFVRPFTKQLKKTLQAQKIKTLLFEPQNLTVAEYISLKKIVKLLPKEGIIETLRQEKNKEEIALITQACNLAQKTISFLKKHLKPGKTEKELAWLAEKYLKDEGTDSLAFPTIIASGPNSAIPHHTVSSRILKKGDTILIDLGCKVAGYCSDITRTFFVGSPTSEQERIESVVKEAHQAALDTINHFSHSGSDRMGSPGVKCATVDQAARLVITQAKLGRFFIHGTGHSLGLDIHETPSISPHSKDVLKENMVITVEPGIYIPGKFGYRHEDTILITKSGYKNLTNP